MILLLVLLHVLDTTSSYVLSAQQSNDLETFSLASQPSDATRKQGQTFTFSCIVEGSGEYQYAWYKSPSLKKGGHSISNSVSKYQLPDTQNTLSFSSLDPDDTAYYHCKVSSGTFTLISNTGYLKVEYYEEADITDTSKVTAQKNAYSAVLDCDVPKSDKEITISWTKDDKEITGKRMFQIPNTGATGSGQLHIFNVQSGDADWYKCSAQYTEEGADGMSEVITRPLTQVAFTVEGSISADRLAPEIVFKTDKVESTVGGEAEFYCAAKGYPTPTITWTSKSGASIQSSDSVFLTDNNRKLKIGNVHDRLENEYTCIASNSEGEKKAIMYLSIKPSTYDIKFVARPVSYIIYHNKYTPFKFTCAVEKRDTQMYWLKNGDYLAYSDRMSTSTETIDVNGTEVQESVLDFITPNESDLGIYQCMVENSEKMRQATAYLNVKKEQAYDNEVITEKEYFVQTSPKKVDEAEEFCRVWRKYGHLVSIMNEAESKEVVELMDKHSITTSWIGLTRENPNTPGYWKWTQPADHSTSFSYWVTGTPDNKGEDESYAIMDSTQNGNWLDISNTETHPFVCKNYLAKCDSIAKFFHNTALPTTVMETASTTYGIGEEITIACADTSTKLKAVVTCKPSGEFFPSTIECPIVSHAQFNTPFYSLIILIIYFICS